WKKLYNVDENCSVKDFYTKVFESINKFEKKENSDNSISVIQLFLQHFTSYNHRDDFSANRGTLLKTIAVLPLLAEKTDFNAIMLLPHFERSTKFMKGNAGSPYSVKDYYNIDPELQDKTIDCDVKTQFGAFVECAHKLGMKVFIDMVPRTAARDSLWILENPEWFYWVKPENTEKVVKLLQTEIPGLGSPASMTADIIDKVLDGLPLEEIINLFEFAPSITAPEKWEKFVEKNRNNHNFLDELVKEFNVITPPCTSDCVNDPQPAWTDVTPLRFYSDYDKKIMEKIDNISEKPPFFIQPVLKASNFYGNNPIKDLWQKIAQIPQYYVDNFKVDGLRGDMFHALPSDMIDMMTANLPENFILIMENLDNLAGENLSVKHGFHYYTGNLFMVITESMNSINHYLKTTSSYNTAVLGMPVIGDSVPLFSREKKVRLFQSALPAFFPNSAYGITADTLVQNNLPLNYGLGFTTEMQKDFDSLLAQANRKLAYFNNDYLTEWWDNIDEEYIKFIKKITETRNEIFSGNSNEIIGLNSSEDGFELRYIIKNSVYEYEINAFTGKDSIKISRNGDLIFNLNSKIDGSEMILNSYSICVFRRKIDD
ncbi:MAG: hypothetical protein WC002_05390, partial [Candidatus Muiribacteriota bacterium]